MTDVPVFDQDCRCSLEFVEQLDAMFCPAVLRDTSRQGSDR